MDKQPFELIHNVLYFLEKVQNNLIIHKITNKLWNETLDSLRQTLQQIPNNHLNIHHIYDALINAEESFLTPLILLSDSTLSHIDKKDYSKMSYLINQLGYIDQYIPVMLTTSPDCIFSKSLNDPCWTLINQNLQIVQIDSKKNIQQAFIKLEKLFHLGIAYAMLGEEQKNKNLISRFIKQHYGIAKCLFDHKAARSHALQAYTRPDLTFALKLIGSTENPLLVQSLKFLFPKINFHKTLFIPRQFEPLTFEQIHKEINEPFTKIGPPKLINFDHPSYNSNKNSNTIQIRLLSSQKEIIRETIDENLYSSIINSIQLGLPRPIQVQSGTTIKKIVYHIHGGGWISTSSFFHQNYTRKWANFLGDDTLLISIDYRLAPEYTYPFALDDCWQVYLWIVNFASVFLKISPEQILITGDSAGGNMALGVTYRAIKQGLRKPDAIFLPYPAISMDLKKYSPSNFFGILDTLTPFSMVNLALDCYMNITGIQPASDPYLSPAIASDEYLRELPNLIITCGSLDSQKDNMIQFLYRLLILKQNGKTTAQAKMVIYDGFPHGYLNYDHPGLPITQLTKLIDDSSRFIQELFEQIQ